MTSSTLLGQKSQQDYNTRLQFEGGGGIGLSKLIFRNETINIVMRRIKSGTIDLYDGGALNHPNNGQTNIIKYGSGYMSDVRITSVDGQNNIFSEDFLNERFLIFNY